MPPVKNPCYDFLRRHYPHQVIGSKPDCFLSACEYKLPCIYLRVLYIFPGNYSRRNLKDCGRSLKRREYGIIAANQHIAVANQGLDGYDYDKGRGGKAEEASCPMY